MSRRPSLPRPLAARVAAAIVALVGLMLALLAGLWQHHHNQSTTARAFDRLADSTVQQIQMRLMRYDAGLHGLRGAVLAAGGRSLRLEQMRAYIDSREMDREFPGARGFGVIWRVSPAQEAAFVAAARADGRPDFQVQQINPHDGERRVITFVEPVSRNQAALGLDVASEPNRLRSTVQSTLSGEATLTGPITLLQARGQTSRGLLLTLPIYRYGAPLDSAAAREAATLGWAYAPLVVDEVLDRLPGDGQQFLLSLIDLASSAAGESSPLYASHPTPPLQPDATLPAAERSFDVQGRRWQARLHATPEFVAGLNTIEPVRVTLGIALLAALLAVVVYQLMQGRARALRERLEVARRAAIVEGSEDAIIGASLEGVITEWNGGAERLFGYSADEALGATIEELLLPPDRMAEDVQFRATIASGRRVPPFDTLRRHRDGSLIAVSLTAGPILDADGHCVGMAKTLRDMREAQRARAELAALNTSLEQQVASRTAALVNALRDNTALLQTLDRFAIVAVTDRDGRITEVNEGFCRVSGFTAGELVGRNYRAALSGEQDAGFWHDMWTQLQSGEPWRGEICNRAKDGALYWIDSIVAPFLDAEGAIERYICISTDITLIKRLQQEAERARQAAEEANRFLQEVTDRLPLRISYLDPAHRFRFVNAAQCESYGLARDALLGQQPQLFEDGRAPQALREHFDAVLRGEPRTFETEIRGPDGAMASYEVRLVPDLRDGAVVGYYSVASDISVRKHAEQELRRTLSTLRAVLDAATQVAIMAGGLDGRLHLFNRGAEQLTGYRAEDVMGRPALELLHDPAELAARRDELAQAWGVPVDQYGVFLDPRVVGQPRDWHYVCKDGRRVPVSVAVTPIRDDTGKSVGFLGIAYDISARLQFEQSLREAMHRANQANQAKSEFLANMSHEIRTPMNAVIGLSYLLERTRLDAEQAGFVGKIKLASKSLLAIINDVLDLSKIEAAEMTMERAPFSLPTLLDELGPLMAVQADAKGIAFAVERPADLAEAVEGDATRLRQVLTNLLSNAIKFTSQGEVRLIVEQQAATADAVQLRLAVRDTGIGIPPEALERVFQPFAQADASTTRRYGGTGLGLSIVRQLVTLMGGRLEVRSEPGVGSEFSVHLDLPRASVRLLPPPPDTGPAGHQALAGLRLLVVDDGELNLEVARRILELQGAQVTLASNGQQALDHLIATPQGFDLVLMDVQMPVLDGHDATRRIRTALGLTQLPIIALTAGVTVGEKERAAAAGMNDMLGKPFEPDELVACILRHLAPGQAGVPAPASPAAAPRADADGWPAVAGVDMADARRRLGGDLGLMRSLMRRLQRQFADLQQPAPPDAAALPALARRMHQLKGTAGTLGMQALQQAAAQTENACRAGSTDDSAAGLQRVAEQLRSLQLAAADFLAAETPAESADAPQPLARAAVAALRELLLASDLAALQALPPLTAALRQHLPAGRYEALQAHMEGLDFAAAAAVLDSLPDAALQPA